MSLIGSIHKLRKLRGVLNKPPDVTGKIFLCKLFQIDKAAIIKRVSSFKLSLLLKIYSQRMQTLQLNYIGNYLLK
jgi:hypothetical protein